MTDHNIPAAEDVSEDDFETVGDYHRIAVHHSMLGEKDVSKVLVPDPNALADAGNGPDHLAQPCVRGSFAQAVLPQCAGSYVAGLARLRVQPVRSAPGSAQVRQPG